MYPTVFAASFGPNGFRTTGVRTRQTNGAAGGAAAQADRPRGFKGIVLQLLPIIIFFAMAFSNTLFDIFASVFSTPDPTFSFVPTPHLSLGRTTGGRMDIPYFVNPTQFAAHPYATPPVTEQPSSKTEDGQVKEVKERRSAGLRRWEKGIEERWVNWKYNECTLSRERIDRQIEAHRGVFGLGTDWEAVNKLREQRKTVETCNELKEKGYSI
jgi:DnaJ homolog subfamily B member 12